jgi:hypothetical protein
MASDSGDQPHVTESREEARRDGKWFPSLGCFFGILSVIAILKVLLNQYWKLPLIGQNALQKKR